MNNVLLLNLELIKELVITEKQSTCSAKQVGCVLFDSKEKKPLYNGFNTSCCKQKCNKIFKKNNGIWYFKSDDNWIKDTTNTKHKNWSLLHEVHAEIQALSNKTTFVDSALITYSPCIDCCKSLISAGIKYIYYIYEFDDIEPIKALCSESDVIIKNLINEDFNLYHNLRKLYI